MAKHKTPALHTAYMYDDIDDLPDPRYTQESAYGDRIRSHAELEEAKVRKPRLDEGVSFREKI